MNPYTCEAVRVHVHEETSMMPGMSESTNLDFRREISRRAGDVYEYEYVYGDDRKTRTTAPGDAPNGALRLGV